MQIDFKFRKKSGIYCIQNTITGKMYIGSSSDIYNRLHGHFNSLRRGNHYKKFQAAYNKYGKDSFTCRILELTENDFSVLQKREQFHIDNLKPDYNTNYEVNKPFRRKFTSSEKEQIAHTVKENFNKGNPFSRLVESQKKIVYCLNLQTKEETTFESLSFCAKQLGTTIKILHVRIKKKVAFNQFALSYSKDFSSIVEEKYLKRTGREIVLQIFNVNRELIGTYPTLKEGFKTVVGVNYSTSDHKKYLDSDKLFKKKFYFKILTGMPA